MIPCLGEMQLDPQVKVRRLVEEWVLVQLVPSLAPLGLLIGGALQISLRLGDKTIPFPLAEEGLERVLEVAVPAEEKVDGEEAPGDSFNWLSY